MIRHQLQILLMATVILAAALCGCRQDGDPCLECLLTAEKSYKEGNDTLHASCLPAAIAYYDRTDDRHLLAKARFLNARSMMVRQDYENAIVELMRAGREAGNLDDDLLGGLIERNLAECYDDVEDISSALLHYRRAARHFSRLSDKSYYTFVLYDLARCHSNSCDYRNARRYADTLYALTH